MNDIIVQEIEEGRFNPEQKKELISIYHKYIEHQVDEELAKRADAVMSSMFQNALSYVIPMDFIESNIGRVLLKIKLEVTNFNEEVYTIADVCIISGKSRQLVTTDINKGKCDAKKFAGRLSLTEKSLIEYLTVNASKPMSIGEFDKKLARFKKLKREGKSVKEIAKIMK